MFFGKPKIDVESAAQGFVEHIARVLEETYEGYTRDLYKMLRDHGVKSSVKEKLSSEGYRFVYLGGLAAVEVSVAQNVFGEAEFTAVERAVKQKLNILITDGLTTIYDEFRNAIECGLDGEAGGDSLLPNWAAAGYWISAIEIEEVSEVKASEYAAPLAKMTADLFSPVGWWKALTEEYRLSI